jgi:hypothetical protein
MGKSTYISDAHPSKHGSQTRWGTGEFMANEGKRLASSGIGILQPLQLPDVV